MRAAILLAMTAIVLSSIPLLRPAAPPQIRQSAVADSTVIAHTPAAKSRLLPRPSPSTGLHARQ